MLGSDMMAAFMEWRLADPVENCLNDHVIMIGMSAVSPFSMMMHLVIILIEILWNHIVTI